ncbi:hypothetical protein DAETH_47000 (plasmid) [Deinococcus aetherius]|uniref:Uncharacterized protein n=1 Tax=Deinococcus aetherius TaxID=200252 RepID=A0ABM8ALV4_9DEIO|nr:hypothetical protein DAETH_47000 [Deinococcus aetherius]
MPGQFPPLSRAGTVRPAERSVALYQQGSCPFSFIVEVNRSLSPLMTLQTEAAARHTVAPLVGQHRASPGAQKGWNP